MKKKELKIEYLAPGALKPYANNAKLHPATQIEQIKKSIEQFGFNDPIAIWGDDTIIEGHGRLIAALELEIDKIPVIRLNRKIKEPYIRKMKELCDELGMRFYVSDSHFKECSHNACCCALPPEWEYSRGHFAAALQIAKKTGEVRFSDIEKDMGHLDTFLWKKAEGFNCNSSEARAKFEGMTMKGYLRYLWNAPARGQSPYKIFEHVLIPDGYDENNDIIYKYNQSVTFEPGQNGQIDGMKA